MLHRGMKPKIESALGVDQLAEAERVEHQQRRGDRHRHGQLVTDHLRGAAQSAEQRVFIVRRPAGQRDTVNAHSGKAENEQHADVEVGQLHRRLRTVRS